MDRPPRDNNPRLEALLHERDHLRIEIKSADNSNGDAAALPELRRRLLNLEREILNHWGSA